MRGLVFNERGAKMKARILRTLLIVAVLCFVGWTAYAQRQTSSIGGRTVWEYKTVRGNRALRDDQLNGMGAQGWELVLFDDGARGNGSYEGTYYFKRAK